MSHSSVTQSKTDNSHHHSSLSRACYETRLQCAKTSHLSAGIFGHLLLTMAALLWVLVPLHHALQPLPWTAHVGATARHTFFLARRSSALDRVSEKERNGWDLIQGCLKIIYILQSFKTDEL